MLLKGTFHIDSLMRKANVPPGTFSSLQTEQARDYWQRILHELTLGKIEDGMGTLVDTAAAEYPGCRRLTDLANRLRLRDHDGSLP